MSSLVEVGFAKRHLLDAADHPKRRQLRLAAGENVADIQFE
jgi:hypothetical protein